MVHDRIYYPNRRLRLSIVVICTYFLFAISGLSESVSTAIFGVNAITCASGDDTYVSSILIRTPEFTGVVEAVQTENFKVVASGEPNWGSNQFVYAKGVQSNYYYLKFISGALEGAWYNIKANDSYSIEIEIDDSEIAMISVGDSFQIIPHWSLNTLLPDGRGVTKNQVRNYGRNATTIYKYTGFENGEIFYQTGKNNSADCAYYYREYGETSSWMNVSVQAPDDIIEPDTFFMVRQPSDAAISTYVSGVLPLCATSIVASNLSETCDTDNYIVVPSATDISLSDLTDALVGSGLFVARTTRAYLAVDTLYAYDNSLSGENRSSSGAYYYRSYQDSAHWYEGTSASDSVMLKAGTAIVLRKLNTGRIESFRAKFTPSYIETNK